MQEVKLSKDMNFLKCYDSQGNWLGDNGMLDIQGKVGKLTIGTFKQTLSLKKCQMILDAQPNSGSGAIIHTMETPVLEKHVESTVPVKYTKKQLESKSLDELREIALSIYADDQIDGRWKEKKLIEVILKG